MDGFYEWFFVWFGTWVIMIFYLGIELKLLLSSKNSNFLTENIIIDTAHTILLLHSADELFMPLHSQTSPQT